VSIVFLRINYLREKKSGFAECWKQDHQWSDEELSEPHVFDIWNDRRTGKYLNQGVYHMEELIPGMLRADNPDKLYEQTEWSYGQRQTVQIMKATGHHDQDERPEGQKKTAISDKEKERIIKENGTYKLSEKEWIEMLNKYDKY